MASPSTPGFFRSTLAGPPLRAHEIPVRFGTDSTSNQKLLQPGDRVSLGLHRADVITTPVDALR
jgi:hypothetical protein